jgi:hypothetical protein
LRRLVASGVLAVLVVACSSERTLGPLTITPPEGWFVSDREVESIKVTNGTIADETATKPGTATAVFDVYIDSAQTVEEFEKALKGNNVDPKKERTTIGGYDAVIVSYGSSAFGPSTEVVFVPSWRVRAVYRAAYPDDESAFVENRPAFRTALRSIRFEGRPPERA